MHKITLICSLHRDNGLCNARELFKILRAIEPDTIFEEARPSDVNSDNKGTLEDLAVTKYREFKSFQRVPVDQYDLPQGLRAVTDSVLDRVEQISDEYLVLTEERHNAVNLQGFAYLNSLAFARVMTRMSEIEEKTINNTQDQDLIRGLAIWRDLMQRRESAMVGNIYEYGRKNVFDTGVFLVGAAHKSGIVKAIEKYAGEEADLVHWNFHQ